MPSSFQQLSAQNVDPRLPIAEHYGIKGKDVGGSFRPIAVFPRL